MSEREDDEPVPKLPRGRGLRLTGPEMFRIVLTGGMLVAVLMLAKPCGNAVSTFVMGFEKAGSGQGSATIPRPGTVDLPGSAAAMPGSAGDYVELHPGMTDEQVKQAIDQAKAKAKQRAGSAGSGASSSP